MGECIYCEERRVATHCKCESCGKGMCDECWEGGVSSENHFFNPLQNCDSKIEIDLISKMCNSNNPQYVCEECVNEKMILKKIEFIKKDLESLVGTRWRDREELEKHLQDKYELDSSLGEIDESGLVGDYAFLMGITKDFGYMDIYYLKVPFGEKSIYVTEVSASAE